MVLSPNVIQAIPKMGVEERHILRKRATAWLKSGSKEQAAGAKAALEALEAVETREREDLVRHVESLDKTQRVAEAFQRVPLSEHERRVVLALLDYPGQSSEALSKSLGWEGQAWQLHFGTLCKERRHLLWSGPYEERRRAEFSAGILADFDSETRRFTMKPEAVEGFRRIGLKPSPRL